MCLVFTLLNIHSMLITVLETLSYAHLTKQQVTFITDWNYKHSPEKGLSIIDIRKFTAQTSDSQMSYVNYIWHMDFVLIHEADPQSRPVVIIVFAHIVRTSVPTFQNKTNFKRKQSSLLANLWVYPSGSLMTPVLFCLYLYRKFRITTG